MLNKADMPEVGTDPSLRELALSEHPEATITGKVRVFVADGNTNVNAIDIHEIKPTMTAKMTVTETIAPVLKNLAELYSPVRSKFFIDDSDC